MVDKSKLAIATSQIQNPIPFLIELLFNLLSQMITISTIKLTSHPVRILSNLQTFIAQKYSGIIKNNRVVNVVCWLIIEPQLFADSFFVKKPERVETILFIMSLCLLVYNLGQRELRKTLLWNNNKVIN